LTDPNVLGPILRTYAVTGTRSVVGLGNPLDAVVHQGNASQIIIDQVEQAPFAPQQ
jgi:hypothetical protein